MSKAKTIPIFILGSMFAYESACASVSSNLNSFFDGLGYQSNVTTPHAFQGQAAGYYSGGSLFLRSQVKNYQLASLEWPSFSGGCSGIDVFAGSFSVMDEKGLKEMVKNILSNAGMYAFDLALSTVTPQLKSVKDYLQKYVGDINNMNINSCNTAEDLVGGIWPKTESSQQQICRDVSTHGGPFTDWAQARQECGKGGRIEEGIGDGGDRKSEVIINKNLVWDALKNNGLTSSDTELAEMLMSLSGTIIVKNKDDKPTQVKPSSKANSENLIKALLTGGTAKIYSCSDTDKCLDVSEKEITVSDKDSLVSKITQMVQDLNDDIASDSKSLSSKTRGFLEMTPLPVLKYITTNLSLGKAVNPAEFSQVMAVTLLNQYLTENIRTVKEALRQEEDTPMDADMSEQIAEAQRLIADRIASAYRKLVNVNVLINNMKADEQQLVGRISSAGTVAQGVR